MRNQFLLGAAIAALAIPAAASAQETTSTIRGTVTANGAPVAGATVVAINVPSGTRSETTTGGDGSFNLPGLRVGGPFTVEVTSPSGNKTVTDIFTVVQQAFDLPVELAAAEDAGSTAGEIVVTANSIQGAGTTSDGPQTVLTQEDVRRVASVNRDIRDIERRDPLASLDLSNTRAVSFAGVNPRFNRFTINGVQVGDQFGLNSDANPTGRGPVPFDAIAQVSTSFAPYDIRQGNFQGVAIDTVLLSGTNTFHGTGFYSQSRDELQGKRIGSNTLVLPDYNSETYGATLSGPIIADKLFFMVSAERNTDPRPFTPSTAAQVTGLNQGVVDAITGIASSVYNYDTGGILSINNQRDEKIVGRIDWNIATGHRLSLSYVNAYESAQVLQNTNANSTTTPSLGLESNAYERSVLVRAGIAQLNSEWTDNFSTEARFQYKSQRTGQNPLRGRGFAEFRVCTDAASVGSLTACSTGIPIVAFGPDISRQTNELFNDTWGGSLQARYVSGGHDVKALFEVTANRTFNYFLQRTSGAYYFDSIADFRNRSAASFDFANAVSLNLPDVAADFRYQQYSFGLQDTWDITDTLQVNLGVRYDVFAQRSPVAANNAFFNRFGFFNTQTYKGLDNFQPRFSFNWQPPIDNLRIRGGVGVFGGGSPDIYLSNSYSNTGVLSNRLTTVQRATGAPGAVAGSQNTATCTAPYTGANAALCQAALNGVTGTNIPAAANTFLSTNTASLLTAPTNALAQDFRLPSVTKATLSADYKLFGFNLGADYIFSKTNESVAFTDIRSIRIGSLPDGRPRYNATTLYNGQIATTGLGTDTNQDILLYNDSRGRTHIGVVRFQKEFDWGLYFGGSYALQDVKDVSPATSSTASSNYANAAMADPNFATYGKSSDETTWAFKYNIGFDHAFFGDYKTTISLFGETRSGRRYSFTMQDPGGNRSPVFGTVTNIGTNGNTRFLMYVPTGTTDPLVSYDSAATQAAVDGLIERTNLKKYRGGIAAKNIARNRAFTRIDLHLEQELPAFIGNSRVSVFADIENLPNLLNSNWGGLRQLGFPYQSAVVQVQCLSAPVATGTGVVNIGTTAANNPTGLPAVANTNSTQACAQYRYSSFRDPAVAEISPSISNSLYLIRVGARFSF
ncbi:TonB-dependent receptor [Sphingomonas sp.]|jgi:hypothetical protein|uniref:TonB-dependent receptor n=1 Tax=Sphingomonas sp. TaxID=28214 RepID=UPI002D7F0534|nr:TonB-dependent receptor [Sphingomonas sp.]HEU0045939.1 TonB-dependent receptor [Sphingomonas sp.]